MHRSGSRTGGAGTIGDIEGEASTAALRRIFDDADRSEAVRVRALDELAARQVSGQIDWLARIARTDASIEVRKRAVRHLGRSGDPAARSALEAILRNGG